MPPDVAVRYVEELLVAVLAAEVDPVALEPRNRGRLLGSDLHLANGIHCGSDHLVASVSLRSRDSPGALAKRVPMIRERGVSQT